MHASVKGGEQVSTFSSRITVLKNICLFNCGNHYGTLSFTQVLKLKDMDSCCHHVMTKANLTHIKPPSIWQFFLFSHTLLKNVHLISSLTEFPDIIFSSPFVLLQLKNCLTKFLFVVVHFLGTRQSPSLFPLLTLNRLNSRRFSTIRHVFNYSSHS